MKDVNLDDLHKEITNTHKTPVPAVELNGKTTLHLADVTVKAVDQIGEHAAKEIEALADELRKESESVVMLLGDLAAAMREHSIQASAQVAEFVKKTTHMAEVVRGLEAKLKETSENT
jgi:hypothetical protein